MQWAQINHQDEEESAAIEGITQQTRRPCRASVWPLIVAVSVIAVIVLTHSQGSLKRQDLLPAQPSFQSKAAALESPIFGGKAAGAAFEGFLAVWRGMYQDNDGTVPELDCNSLPKAFNNVHAKIVLSAGGAAEGGVVTEGIGYGIMVEGVQAAAGNQTSLKNGLALMKAWLGMVQGPAHTFKKPTSGSPDRVIQPLGGADGVHPGAATKVDVPPYGVSAIDPQGPAARGPSGVAAWKYPINACSWGLCTGSATDGDEDAVFGMIYLAAALGYPDDFTDTVMRAVISVASADLGFPDLYRTLPDGTKVFVPKGGSMWGGLAPSEGRFKTTLEPGCINPSYFSPASYRLFRDFVKAHWKFNFDKYLPPHLNGDKSTLFELMEAFDGAVIGGYNLLYRSTCSSGVVSNWAGSQAECSDQTSLSCDGVPWAFTPHVGAQGTCSVSGTKWGSWGKDACRGPWRIAMDYVLYPAESTEVKMYDTNGHRDHSIDFNSKTYLNRLARQYTQNAKCNGGKPGDCDRYGRTDAEKLAPAFVAELGAPDLTCDNVPHAPEPNWWAAEMSHPTFAGFVAPLGSLSAAESASWLDTFAKICNFSSLSSYDDMDTQHGVADLCSKTYFQASQQVISAMVMSGTLRALPSRAGLVA
mmetsp:Transcript_80962/g.196302  ORF Transcript_80962/g.196302 Transcript_80962/m.196302 type:complete len:642 (+) Transcript_80962:51-1976(+)